MAAAKEEERKKKEAGEAAPSFGARTLAAAKAKCQAKKQPRGSAAAAMARAAAAEDWRGPAARPVGTRSAAGEAPAESRDERGAAGSATDDFRGGAVDVDCSAPSVVSAAATAQTCGLSNDNPAAAKAAAATRLVLTSPATTTN